MTAPEPLRTDPGTPRWLRRSRNLLGCALALSLLAHLAVALWPVEMPARSEPTLLSATITEMPAPPVQVAPPAKRAPPKHRARAVVPAVPEAVPALEATEAAAVATDDLVIPGAAEATEVAAAPPAPTEETLPAAAPDAARERTLPPRIELVYRGFLGTRGFFIGDAVYRLEHADNQYRITTIGEARGLAALFLRGQGRLYSEGTITSEGLQPNVYTAERTSDGRHEVANFDWESGVVLLNDNKTAGLELPTFDPLAALWQFYFSPPQNDDVEFNVATTRRVYRARFHRVGAETINLTFGDVATEIWDRTGGDGNLTARVWLAPSLHHVMVKMRVSNGRITGEALLDSIHVDETVAQQ